MKTINRLFSVLFLMVLIYLLGCENKQNPVVSNNSNNFKLAINSSILLVNDSIKISITMNNNIESEYIFQWSVNMGKIKGSGHQVKYIAPENTGTARFYVTIHDSHSNFFTLSDSIVIVKQLIILKADDMYWDNINTISDNWSKFIELIFRKGIKASLGVIGKSLEYASNDYFIILNYLNSTGQFELWNHGYDHVLNEINENGESYCEFKNTSYLHQQQHLEKTQELGKNKLNIIFRTFGAPGNAFDETTFKLIDENDEILIWFFGNPKSKKLVLKRYGEIEFPIFNPDFNKFMETYDRERDYYVLQLHPNKWDDSRFAEFEKIVDYLIENKSKFITPLEYYQYIQLKMLGTNL
ncbi:hypothetical protein JXQ31_05585 [candidate division KSB1 bacterium]|nr:hypothetical protein [candidate division KSB1 bacterium]